MTLKRVSRKIEECHRGRQQFLPGIECGSQLLFELSPAQTRSAAFLTLITSGCLAVLMIKNLFKLSYDDSVSHIANIW